MVLWVFGFAATGHASSSSKKSYEEKTLQIWGQDVQYQYLVKNDPKVDFDGVASFETVNGQKIYKVVINPVYFEREARGLFQRYLQDKQASEDGDISGSDKGLFLLEKQLAEMSRPETATLSPEAKTELKKVQLGLERLAWKNVFEESRKNSSSIKEAEKNFIRKFTQDRMFAIERHEASHILDLKVAGEKSDDSGFARFTELNAFYTELAFGSNPLDVMSQAISGLIDEMGKGKPVDFSVEKVSKIVIFLKKCPRFASYFSGQKMPKCCLEMMGEFTHQEFQFTAKELYHNSYQGFKPILASLR